VSVAPTTVNEGGTASFTISAIPAPSQSVTVFYTTSGTATPGTDYTLGGTPNQAVIPAGQTSVTIPFHALLDTATTEKRESVKLKLSAGTGYKLNKTGKSATIKIINVP
jgi:hypothetical protein